MQPFPHLIANSTLIFFGASQVVLVVKNLSANAGDIRDVCSIPGSGKSSEEGHSNPFQSSCLENPMDRGARRATVHRVTKSQIRLKQLGTHHTYNVLVSPSSSLDKDYCSY